MMRRELYGRNEFDEPERRSWLQIFVGSFEDTTLIILITAAAISITVGLYEKSSSGWIEGAAILFAVLLVALVTATNDYKKESQFRKLNAKKDDITISVIRSGISMIINVKELVSKIFPHFLLFLLRLKSRVNSLFLSFSLSPPLLFLSLSPSLSFSPPLTHSHPLSPFINHRLHFNSLSLPLSLFYSLSPFSRW